jgi:hypothetical protein
MTITEHPDATTTEVEVCRDLVERIGSLISARDRTTGSLDLEAYKAHLAEIRDSATIEQWADVARFVGVEVIEGRDAAQLVHQVTVKIRAEVAGKQLEENTPPLVTEAGSWLTGFIPWSYPDDDERTKALRSLSNSAMLAKSVYQEAELADDDVATAPAEQMVLVQVPRPNGMKATVVLYRQKGHRIVTVDDTKTGERKDVSPWDIVAMKAMTPTGARDLIMSWHRAAMEVRAADVLADVAGFDVLSANDVLVDIDLDAPDEA